MIYRRKKSKQLSPAPTESTLGPCPPTVQINRTLGTESYPAPSYHPSTPPVGSALTDILEAFKTAENFSRLEEARETAGNDMLRHMQIVFPIAAQIQMDMIQKYGFPADGDGIIRFTQAVKLYEKQDPVVAQLNNDLRTILIPPVPVRRSTVNPGVS